MLEAACKHIIAEYGLSMSTLELPRLHRHALTYLKLDPEQPDIDEALKHALRASSTIVHNLGYLRNKLGDAHGKSPSGQAIKASDVFIVMLAVASTAFLLDTIDAERK